MITNEENKGMISDFGSNVRKQIFIEVYDDTLPAIRRLIK